MYACLAVTCHLHFWQNDRDFLRATAVTRGWNGYRNKSQHRKSTLKKKILPPFQQGFEPATFQSRVRCSNHWAIPAPTMGKFFLLLLFLKLWLWQCEWVDWADDFGVRMCVYVYILMCGNLVMRKSPDDWMKKVKDGTVAWGYFSLGPTSSQPYLRIRIFIIPVQVYKEICLKVHNKKSNKR